MVLMMFVYGRFARRIISTIGGPFHCSTAHFLSLAPNVELFQPLNTTSAVQKPSSKRL